MAAKKVNLSPLGGRILVQPLQEEDGLSIIIPDTAKEETKPQKGTVVALGTGRILQDGTKVDFNVKIGDTVFFKQYAPDKIELGEGDDAEEYLIMEEDDVLAIIA